MFRPRTLCQMKPSPQQGQQVNQHKSSLPLDYFSKLPKHSGKPKEFPSKTKKPLQISTKGFLTQKIDKKLVEDIQPKEQKIDFERLLLQFKNATEVQSLQITDLLNIDADLLETLKKKCRDFTDAASYLSEAKEKSGQIEEAKSDQQFMQYLMEQYVQMQNNSINLDIAVNNIEKIKHLQYNDEGVLVFYSKK